MRNFLLISGWFAMFGAVCPAQEAASVVVGKLAPDIRLTGLDGKPFRLSDLTRGGKNVALMFSRAHW
jgi:hypothetical protein